MAAFVLGGCVALPAPAPTELLDERTGVTITVVDEPILLARDRREVAANARDYVTLVAAAQNNSGRVSVALVAYYWSTIDERTAAAAASSDPALKLLADGRDLTLTASEPFPAAFANPENLLAPPASRYERRAYPVDREALEFLASSRRLAALHGSDVGAWDNRQR
jgi:hypothetical protein